MAKNLGGVKFQHFGPPLWPKKVLLTAEKVGFGPKLTKKSGGVKTRISLRERPKKGQNSIWGKTRTSLKLPKNVLIIVPGNDANGKQDRGFIERETETYDKNWSVGAWAGELLPVISGNDVFIGEDLLEGHSWTIGVMLLSTVGVELLWLCVCAN